MTNKKLNIILAILSVCFVIIFLYLLFLYKRNEKSKISFEISKITNVEWINNDEDSFYLDNDKLTFKISNTDVISNKKYTFNNRTGKFDIDGDSIEIYLRSIGEDNIVIWYNKKEYHFEKKIINK